MVWPARFLAMVLSVSVGIRAGAQCNSAPTITSILPPSATVYPPNYCANGPDCYCPDTNGYFQCNVTCAQGQPCTLNEMAVHALESESGPQPGAVVVYGSNFCAPPQIE
jgi:hypothetical protein